MPRSRARGAADPRRHGIPPLVAAGRGAAAVRASDRARPARSRAAATGSQGPAGMDAHARDLAPCSTRSASSGRSSSGTRWARSSRSSSPTCTPSGCRALVLVDGGLPLDVPAGLSPDELIQLVLGPTAERLSMRFASRGRIPRLLARHPAFRRDWSPDARGVPRVRPRRRGARAASGDELRDARRGLDRPEHRHGDPRGAGALRHPTLLLTAERGLLDQVPPLYSPTTGCRAAGRVPGGRARARRGREPLHDRDVRAGGGCRGRRRAGELASRRRRRTEPGGQRARGDPGRELVRVREERAAELGRRRGRTGTRRRSGSGPTAGVPRA